MLHPGRQRNVIAGLQIIGTALFQLINLTRDPENVQLKLKLKLTSIMIIYAKLCLFHRCTHKLLCF